MAKQWVIALSLLALTACDNAENGWNTGARNAREGYDRTRWKLSDWLYKRNPEEYSELSKPVTYCYQLQMEVLCYHQPQAHLANQLVGLQGDNEAPVNYFTPATVKNRYSDTGLNGAPVMQDSRITTATISSETVSAREITSQNVVHPFADATDETMRRAKGQSGSYVTHSKSNIVSHGAPTPLMHGR